jgi:hypothetical protein
VTTKSDAAVRQLSQLDPATRFAHPGNAADIALRIQRILEVPAAEWVIVESAHRAWRRPVLCGLAASVAMALAAVLLWASPAEGSFSAGRVAAAEIASHHVSGEGHAAENSWALAPRSS